MPEQNRDSQDNIDELISAFADQVTENDTLEKVEFSEDEKIKGLQETVFKLHRLSTKAASVDSAAKIKKNVGLAWEAQQARKPSIFEKILQGLKAEKRSKGFQSTARRQQIMVTRIAAAVVVVILATFVFLPGSELSGGSASGTAAGDMNPSVIVGGIGVLGVIAVMVWIKSRRN